MAATTTVSTHKNLRWIDIVEPDKNDLEQLHEEFGFHPLDLEDCLSEVQRPKIDEYDNYLFIVLHLPVVGRNKRLRISEVDIFIGQNFLVTLHDGELPPLKKLLEKIDTPEGKQKLLTRGSGYLLYEVISRLFNGCFPLLDSLLRTANRLEKDVFEAESPRDLLRDILFVKKDLITFRRLLSPQRTVITALEHKNKKFLPDELEVYFDDVVDRVERMWGQLESLKEVVEALRDANESIISHTTGNTIRVLTVFSVVMLPLTLLTGFFGMNVPIPHQTDHAAIIWIGVLMTAVAAGMVAFFHWKKWL